MNEVAPKEREGEIEDFPAAAGAPACLPLFGVVRLTRPLHVEEGDLPAGASGTIVEILDPGRAYVVEFDEPRHEVAIVYDEALECDPLYPAA